MGLMDELRKLARPYEDEDEYEDEEEDVLDEEEEEEEEEETPRVRRSAFRRESPKDTPRTSAPREVRTTSYRDSRPAGGNKVVNINATTQLQVVLVRPEKFENASDIADHLRDKRTVVLNLENTQKDVARRLVDFLSGVAYAQEGKIKKISAGTYIITPYNVDIIGDLVEELESSGLYF